MLDIDTAIKHCLEVAEKNDGEAEVYDLLAKNHNNPYEKLTASKFYTDCAECAADHRQLAEWLMELRANRHYIQKICNELAFLYGSPCQNAKADGFIREIGSCKDCGIAVADSECWQRYFALKLGGADNV